MGAIDLFYVTRGVRGVDTCDMIWKELHILESIPRRRGKPRSILLRRSGDGDGDVCMEIP